MDALDRCLEKVYPDIITGCWLWIAYCDKDGYGIFRDKGMVRAHRFVFNQLRGAIGKGLVLDHVCRHRNCVNPDHLEPVTHLVNVRRGLSGKINNACTRKTECKHGHAFTESNIYRQPRYPNKRFCKKCNAEKQGARRKSAL